MARQTATGFLRAVGSPRPDVLRSWLERLHPAISFAADTRSERLAAQATAKYLLAMNTSTTYVPSKLLTGDAELLRQHSFTRWMSRDLTQAASDFCRNLGQVPAYCETSPDHLTRYLFWRLPQGAGIEVRSGRAKESFEEFDSVNREKNWRLLSLHVNESDVYSAVWITANHFETAKVFLRAHGITPAERRDAESDLRDSSPTGPATT